MHGVDSTATVWRNRRLARIPVGYTRPGISATTPGGPVSPATERTADYGFGGSSSASANSSMFTSLNVTTLTFLANRAGRYMSQTQASAIVTSK